MKQHASPDALGERGSQRHEVGKKTKKHWAGHFDTVGYNTVIGKPSGGCPYDKAMRWEKMRSFPLTPQNVTPSQG